MAIIGFWTVLNIGFMKQHHYRCIWSNFAWLSDIKFMIIWCSSSFFSFSQIYLMKCDTCACHKGIQASRNRSPPVLSWHLMQVSFTLYPQERTSGPHWRGGKASPRAGLNVREPNPGLPLYRLSSPSSLILMHCILDGFWQYKQQEFRSTKNKVLQKLVSIF